MGNKNKKKSDRVKPQLLKGFLDWGPREQLARERMLVTVRKAFEAMGFLPYRTATLESAATLLGTHYTEDSLAELFGFTGPEDVDMALRYEFTLSLARFVAGQPDLALPFKGYQYGTVFRVDKPGPGRYREFMQCDLDIVGTTNLLADSEIIATIVSTFKSLGIQRFLVRFSNRKILNGLVEHAAIPSEQGSDVMRVIDKLEKQGREAVIQELGPGRTDKSGDKIPGVQLEARQIARIEEYLDIAQTTVAGNEPSETALEKVESLLGDQPTSCEGINDLRVVMQHLASMGVDPACYNVDLTIVRGLGYYTGPVFETILLDLPEYGAVFSGGRYDNLVNRFLSRSIPGVGASFGLDRVLAALIELDALEAEAATAQVLVTVMDREQLPAYLKIAGELRASGLRTEVFCGDTKNITKQIKYADKVGIPMAVIAGSDEFAANRVTVKNLELGRRKAAETTNREEWLKAEDIQHTIDRDALIEHLRSQLDQLGRG